MTSSLEDAGTIERDRDVFRLAGRGGRLSPEDEAGKTRVEAAAGAAGLEAVPLAELAARSGFPEAKVKKYADLLSREGRLVRLGDLLFHSEALDELKRRVRDRKALSPELDVAAFREMTGGLSRKYSIPLLEWLDRQRVTRRVGDKREIL